MNFELKLILICGLMIAVAAGTVTLINEYYRGKAIAFINAHNDDSHASLIQGQNIRGQERTLEHQAQVNNSNNNTQFIIDISNANTQLLLEEIRRLNG